MPVTYSLTAASALQHQLTIVTRNVSDFQNTGVLFNPFSALWTLAKVSSNAVVRSGHTSDHG